MKNNTILGKFPILVFYHYYNLYIVYKINIYIFFFLVFQEIYEKIGIKD